MESNIIGFEIKRGKNIEILQVGTIIRIRIRSIGIIDIESTSIGTIIPITTSMKYTRSIRIRIICFSFHVVLLQVLLSV